MNFSHVTTWIFDLDNTLYSPQIRLFSQIEQRMTAYVMRTLDVPEAEASHLRHHYWRMHGTTLAGLMAEHAIEPVAFLNEVHDIDFSELSPDPDLASAIRDLPGSKIIHTNGDSRYAQRVLAHRGLDADLFDAIFGVEEVLFHPKPDARAYHSVIEQHGFIPATAAMFEDDPRNLAVPEQLGMRTVLVGPGRNGPDCANLDQDHIAHVQFRTNDLTEFLCNIAADSKL